MSPLHFRNRCLSVWRFRQATAVTDDAPLSEPSRRITAADPEKEGTDVKIEAASETAVIVHFEEEKFEWREVVRGLTDVQVWLTGFAYMGILVPLYSFSLFLCVCSLSGCVPARPKLSCTNVLYFSALIIRRPTIVAGLGYSGGQAQLHTGGDDPDTVYLDFTHMFCSQCLLMSQLLCSRFSLQSGATSLNGEDHSC